MRGPLWYRMVCWHARCGSLTSVPRAGAPMTTFIERTVGSELNLTLYYALDRWLSEQRSVSAATLKAHKAILDAIKGHDSDTAEAAMELHVKQVEAFYW